MLGVRHTPCEHEGLKIFRLPPEADSHFLEQESPKVYFNSHSLTCSAGSIDVNGPAFRTGARHGPDRHSVKDAAPGVLHAGLDDWAGIDAPILNAHEFINAIDVDPALWLVELCRGPMLAVRVRVPSRQILGAATSGEVVLHVANGVPRARRVLEARIHAASAAAGQVPRAIVVGVALCSLAMHLWVTEVARPAAA